MWFHCEHEAIIPCSFLSAGGLCGNSSQALPPNLIIHTFVHSHHWSFIGLCLTSAFNKMPGGVHRLTHNWLTHAGELCLSYSQATGLRTPTQKRACPTLWRWPQLSASHTAVKSSEGVMRQRSLGGGRGSQQPDTRLTPRGAHDKTPPNPAQPLVHAQHPFAQLYHCVGKMLTY